jgi:hypothetical protein
MGDEAFDWSKVKVRQVWPPVETPDTSSPPEKAPVKEFAYVPLPWGYRALAIAGRGVAIVLYALRMQESGLKRKDVPITDSLLKKWGLNHKIRGRTLSRLEAAGLATVRRRGKYRGCPLLTLHYPRD